jgi:hypothetical protein
MHLSGHVHSPSSAEIRRDGARHQHISVSAGAVHEEKRLDGTPYIHSYNVAALVRTPNGEVKLRIWHRRWSEPKAGFTRIRQDIERQLEDLRTQRWRGLGHGASSFGAPQSIVERMASPGREPLVILGDPGSGKSTLLQVLALRAARDGYLTTSGSSPAGEGGKELLPILRGRRSSRGRPDQCRADHG